MKKGFTLSETLITICVIGVIAALITPALTNSMPSNSKMMFKKAYSTLGQTIDNMSNDTTHYPPSMTGVNDDGDTVERGFNYTCKTANADGTCATYITTSNGVAVNNKFVSLFVDQLNLIGTMSDHVGSSGYWSFTTTDGIVWTIYVNWSDSANGSVKTGDSPLSNTYEFPMTSTYYTTKVMVDVNGTKAPNCTADTSGNAFGFNYLASCTNPDRFIFSIRYDGKIHVGASDNPNSSTDSIAEGYLTAPTTIK